MAPPPREVRTALLALQGLFERPPTELADLDGWLQHRPVEPLREALLVWLASGTIPAERHALCAYLLWRIGLGGWADRLAAVALDQELSFASRAVALSVLSEHDAEHSARVLEALQPFDHLRLLTAPVDDLLNAAVETGEGDCVRRMLADLPPEARHSLYDRVEARRQERGLPAHRLYALALGSNDLGALCGRMLDRIWEEDPRTAIDELAALARGADGDTRARAARAQMRLRSAALAKQGRVVQPRGWGYLTGCDGVGDYLLFVCLAEESGVVIYDLMLRASGEVREADRTSGVAEPEVEGVIAEHAPPAFSPLLRVPLEGVLALLGEVVPPAQLIGCLAELAPLLRRTAGRKGYALPSVDPEPNPEALSLLLSTRTFASWRLSPGDVLVHGVSVPQRTSRRAFLRQLQHAIAAPALQRRLSSMARHMSRVHLWRGDVPAARTLEAAARECEGDLARAPLFALLVDRLFDEISGQRPRDRMQIGTPAIRAALRSALLPEVERPRKADLMRLDLVEVACAALDEALDLVPRDQRPRDGELLDLVDSIGTSYVSALLGNGDAEQVREVLATRLGPLVGIGRQHATALATLVTSRLDQFAQQVCTKCSVGCLARPRTPCSAKFHDDRHPAADLLHRTP